MSFFYGTHLSFNFSHLIYCNCILGIRSFTTIVEDCKTVAKRFTRELLQASKPRAVAEGKKFQIEKHSISNCQVEVFDISAMKESSTLT